MPRALGWLLAAALAAGCGKKGPPLPPFVSIPDAVKQITARRVGDDVLLTLTLPAQNVDSSTPVSLARVDVYGVTARTAPSASQFTVVASLVAAITVGAEPASVAAVRDTLTADELRAAELPGRGQTGGPAGGGSGALRRFYMAIPLSERGRAGPPSGIVSVPLTPLPDPPSDLRVEYTPDTATLSWSPSGGVVGFLLDLAPPPNASPIDDGPVRGERGLLPDGPTRYYVYRPAAGGVPLAAVEPPLPAAAAPPPSIPVEPPAVEAGLPPAVVVSPSPAAAAGPPGDAPAATLLTKVPVDGLVFTEPLQIDGRERCYAVSAVRGTGEQLVEGLVSRPVCVVPVDTFPPAAPTGLSPIASEGAVSLVWEANSEPDLRGYIVLRGESGSGTLRPVSTEIVTVPRFTDETVQPGVEYVYAVTAVDTRAPEPNVSPESERVEIVAR